MKRKIIINCQNEKFGVDCEKVNAFFTNEEKEKLFNFFFAYIKKYYPDVEKKHKDQLENKVAELKEKGFNNVKIKEELIYTPLDHANNIDIDYYYRITWPHNYHMTVNSKTSLVEHYSFNDAFFNENCSKIDILKAEDVQKIINRAISHASLIRDNEIMKSGKRYCVDCNCELTAVRPGKWQCDNNRCPSNQE